MQDLNRKCRSISNFTIFKSCIDYDKKHITSLKTDCTFKQKYLLMNQHLESTEHILYTYVPSNSNYYYLPLFAYKGISGIVLSPHNWNF